MKLLVHYKRQLVFVTFLVISSFAVSAQQTGDLQVYYTDSLQTTEGSQLLSNSIILVNRGKSPRELTLTITPPSFWRLIGNATGQLKIAPGDSAAFPLNFVKNADAPAKWLPVSVIVTDNANKNILHTSQFHIKDMPLLRFRANVVDQEVYVRKESKMVYLEFNLKNTGNLEDKFDIASGNSFFDLNYNQRIRLNQGESQLVRIPIKVTELIKDALITRRVEVKIYSSTLMLKLEYNVNKLTNEIKKNVSAYPVVPIELEAGILMNGGQINSFYAIRGEAKLKDSTTRIKFGYRTKQFGIANTIEQNAFQLGFINKKWDLYAGELADGRHFYSFGQGFSVTHFAKKNVEMGVKGIFHYRISPIKSDLFSAYVKHNLKKIVFNHSLTMNKVVDLHLQSLLLSTEATLWDDTKTRLKLIAAGGQNHFMRKLPGTPLEKAGSLLGYEFSYTREKWNFSSDFQRGSKYFPGNFSESNLQNHTLTVNFGKYSAGLFYMYNKVSNKNFIFRDTVFYTDFLSLNIEQAGIRLSRQFGNLSTTLNAGLYRQTNFNSGQGLPTYKFFEVFSNYRSGPNFSVSLRSFAGFSEDIIDKQGRKAITFNNNFITTFKYGGLSLLYVRVPTSRGTGTSGDSLRYTETMSIAPSVRLNLFRNLKGIISYNIARTVLDSTNIVMFVNANIVYANKRNGLDVRLSGGVPVKNRQSRFFSQTNNGNITLSIVKKINAPIPVRKKYYTLELSLFRDENNNNKQDFGEAPMADIIVKIGSHSFTSDKNGKIYFRHIPKAIYPVDLTKAKTDKGIIPAHGYRQFPKVEKDMVLAIPFQRGKIIEGRVFVTQDKNSTSTFSTDGLKIVINDTLGNYYTTLTNTEGGFYVSVPPGQYKVSMTPESFTGSFFQPMQMSYTINITDEMVVRKVEFEIKQRTRMVKFLNQ